MPLLLSPEARRQRARIGGLTSAAMGRTNTGPATAAAEARFEGQVRREAAERGETPTEAEIARRTVAARRLFFAKLAYKSAQARSRDKRSA